MKTLKLYNAHIQKQDKLILQLIEKLHELEEKIIELKTVDLTMDSDATEEMSPPDSRRASTEKTIFGTCLEPLRNSH